MGDVRDLLEKVEAGTLQDEPYGGMPMLTELHEGIGPNSIPGFRDGTVMRAYHGSLDAALALHKAVLPGCRVHYITEVDSRYPWLVVLLPKERSGWDVEGGADTPARALLIAVLRALSEDRQ